jgi:hypothetical protein
MLYNGIQRSAEDYAKGMKTLATFYQEPAVQYVTQNKAVLESEEKKKRQMQIMLDAQKTRTKFLRLTIDEQALFVKVLTSDDGSLARLFDLQTTIKQENVTAQDLEIALATDEYVKKGLSLWKAKETAAAKLTKKDKSEGQRRVQKALSWFPKTPLLPAPNAASSPLTIGPKQRGK